MNKWFLDRATEWTVLLFTKLDMKDFISTYPCARMWIYGKFLNVQSSIECTISVIQQEMLSALTNSLNFSNYPKEEMQAFLKKA